MALAEGKHMVIVFVSSMIVGKTSLTGALRRLCDETDFEITGYICRLFDQNVERHPSRDHCDG